MLPCYGISQAYERNFKATGVVYFTMLVLDIVATFQGPGLLFLIFPSTPPPDQFGFFRSSVIKDETRSNEIIINFLFNDFVRFRKF